MDKRLFGYTYSYIITKLFLGLSIENDNTFPKIPFKSLNKSL